MRDDFCANDGIMQDKDGTYQGELVLEIHNEFDPIRIYRFTDDTEPKEFFWWASKKLKSVICPSCNVTICSIKLSEQEHEHLDDCSGQYNEQIAKELLEINKDNNEWEWTEIYYSKEAAFLLAFDFMYKTKNELFKKYHDFTYKKEERLRRKYNEILRT